MLVNPRLIRASLLLFLFIIAGCEVTEEESLQQGVQSFESVLEQEAQAPTVEEGSASFYLPNDFDIVEVVDNNNIIIEQQERLFVMFHDQDEPKTSTIHIERDQLLETEALLFNPVVEEDFVSFLLIDEQEEGQLLISVAYGGAKLSTLSTYEHVVDDIEVMTAIVQSYEGQ